MVGPFKTERGSLTHLLVAVDKFTKWVEAKPMKKLDGATATKFIIEITTRFGIPHSIITDNGTNFPVCELSKFCSRSKIRLDVASVAHPQSNGQVERTNGIILQGIKLRLKTPLHRAQPVLGSMNCRQSYGVFVLPQTDRPASPLSSSFTEQK